MARSIRVFKIALGKGTFFKWRDEEENLDTEAFRIFLTILVAGTIDFRKSMLAWRDRKIKAIPSIPLLKSTMLEITWRSLAIINK